MLLCTAFVEWTEYEEGGLLRGNKEDRHRVFSLPNHLSQCTFCLVPGRTNRKHILCPDCTHTHIPWDVHLISAEGERGMLVNGHSLLCLYFFWRTFINNFTRLRPLLFQRPPKGRNSKNGHFCPTKSHNKAVLCAYFAMNSNHTLVRKVSYDKMSVWIV